MVQTTAPTAVRRWMVIGMDNYYVIRNKATGFYFRGKGANRWGKYHNQASVYRMKAHAENTLGWLLRRGEPVEIVPIQIVENPTDIVEVVRCKNCINGIYDEVNDRYKCVKSAEYDPEFGDWLGFVSYCNADYYCADGERKDND